jgi:hypothetical protein
MSSRLTDRRDKQYSGKDKDRVFSHFEWIESREKCDRRKKDSGDNHHPADDGNEYRFVLTRVSWRSGLPQLLELSLKEPAQRIVRLWRALIVGGQRDGLGGVRRSVEEGPQDDQSDRDCKMSEARQGLLDISLEHCPAPLIAFSNGSSFPKNACRGGIMAMKIEMSAAHIGTVMNWLIACKVGWAFSQALARNACRRV